MPLPAAGPPDMPAWQSAAGSSGRFQAWTLVLTGWRTAYTRSNPSKRFRPVLAEIRIEADSSGGDFNRFTMKLTGTTNRAIVPTASWDNTTPDVRWCIRSAPPWVRALFAEVTGFGHLINTYAGPAWAGQDIALAWPNDPAYPVPGDLEAAA